MRYLFKILMGSKDSSTKRSSSHRGHSPAVYKRKSSNNVAQPSDNESGTRNFERLKDEDESLAVFSTEAIGWKGGGDVESGVPMNVIMIRDEIEQVRRQRAS